MVFNSLEFLAFFVVFFLLYWFVAHRTALQQNFLLLLGSCMFYAFCDWKFLSLLLISSATYYSLAGLLNTSRSDLKRKLILYAGLAFGIGLLLLFKYYGFFAEAFYKILTPGGNPPFVTRIIIPLGISFYTFKCIGYLLDVYHGKMKASGNPVSFFCYTTFFPTIISGPIDRAKIVLPQFETQRVFDPSAARNAMLQITWGLFKKTVIADNCAAYTDNVFSNFSNLPGSVLLLAAFLYTIQIYADFSGYSDMAIGLSRLLGFNLTKNFDFPLFSTNIAEFWRKWHMSLTSWFTEYVFTPLTIFFRDIGKMGLILAVIINFTIVGIWHGSKWNFVLFGFLHGCYYVPLILRGKLGKSKKEPTKLTLRSFLSMMSTFILVMLTFVVFRSDTVLSCIRFFKSMFSSSLFSLPQISSKLEVLKFGWVVIFMAIEFYGRRKDYAIEALLEHKPVVRWVFYYLLLISIFVFAGLNQQFIYFQF